MQWSVLKGVFVENRLAVPWKQIYNNALVPLVAMEWQQHTPVYKVGLGGIPVWAVLRIVLIVKGRTGFVSCCFPPPYQSPVSATRCSCAISCSCARTLIHWIVSQSTIVRLFSCYTERNVNQCILNGSVLRQLRCSTKRNERDKERERGRLQNGLPDSTVHPSYCIYVNILYFLSRPPQKLKRPCSTERAFLRQLTCCSVEHVRFSFWGGLLKNRKYWHIYD